MCNNRIHCSSWLHKYLFILILFFSYAKKKKQQKFRFLKGICHKASCLLSHNTTLSKMPTCKFYLQGLCSKNDCPYLHKKVNDKTDICVDFLRGYCELAEKVRTSRLKRSTDIINIKLMHETKLFLFSILHFCFVLCEIGILVPETSWVPVSRGGNQRKL